jgi:hypothetical protein
LDFLIGWYLCKTVSGSAASKKLVLVFWLFNPLSLYTIYMLSGFDLLPVFLTVLAWHYVTQKDPVRAGLFLGLGTAIKSYPLLLLPFVLLRAKNLKQGLAALGLFFAGLILPVLPVIGSAEFRYTMTHSNLMQRIFTAGIEIGGGQSLPVYVIVLALTFWLSLSRRHHYDLLPEFLTVTLSVLLFSHFHAQWAVWCLPFLAVLLARRPQIWPVMSAIVTGIFTVNMLLADQYAFLGLFTIINPQAIFFPPFPEIIASVIDPIWLQSLAHTLLTASGIWLIILAWQTYADK